MDQSMAPIVVVRRMRSRRGFSILYVALALVVLVGFVALGIDVARMHLAKSELQTGADAAARAAAWGYAGSSTPNLAYIRQRAIDMAAANTCDRTPIALASNDVTFGWWNPVTKQFVTNYGSYRPNAVRVDARRVGTAALPLLFAPAVGVNTADVKAFAIAKYAGGHGGLGLVGIEFVDMNGVTSTDSYNAELGPYDPAHPNSNGTVASNGLIKGVGNATINGDAAYYSVPPDGVDITGSATQLDEPLVFPPVDASYYATHNNNNAISSGYTASTQDFKLNNGTITFQGGVDDYTNYYFRNFTTAGNTSIRIQGKVRFWITGALDIGGNVDNSDHLPGNFSIQVQGPGEVQLGGAGNLYADVYCPEAPCTFNGQGNSEADFYGSIVAKSLTFKGNSDVHYDESLNKVVAVQPHVILVK